MSLQRDGLCNVLFNYFPLLLRCSFEGKDFRKIKFHFIAIFNCFQNHYTIYFCFFCCFFLSFCFFCFFF